MQGERDRHFGDPAAKSFSPNPPRSHLTEQGPRRGGSIGLERGVSVHHGQRDLGSLLASQPCWKRQLSYAHHTKDARRQSTQLKRLVCKRGASNWAGLKNRSRMLHPWPCQRHQCAECCRRLAGRPLGHTCDWAVCLGTAEKGVRYTMKTRNERGRHHGTTEFNCEISSGSFVRMYMFRNVSTSVREWSHNYEESEWSLMTSLKRRFFVPV